MRATSIRPQSVTAENTTTHAYSNPRGDFNSAAVCDCGERGRREGDGRAGGDTSIRPQSVTAENLPPPGVGQRQPPTSIRQQSVTAENDGRDPRPGVRPGTSIRPQSVTAENHNELDTQDQQVRNFNSAAVCDCGEPRHPTPSHAGMRTSIRPQSVTAENVACNLQNRELSALQFGPSL